VKVPVELETAESRGRRALAWIILAAGLVLPFAIRLHRLDLPLERDEGDYAYGAQLILAGVPLYKEFYTLRLPGIYDVYALMMTVLGSSTAGIHLGLAIWTTASAIAVFAIGKRLFGTLAGAAAGLAFALLSASEGALGLAGHATHFVVLPAAIGCLLLRPDPPRGIACIAAGLSFGIAILMKQHAMTIAIFGAAYLVWLAWDAAPKQRAARIALYGAGVATPYLLVCLNAWRESALGPFWFWTTRYALEYAGAESVADPLGNLRDGVASVTGSNLPIWLLAAGGAVHLFARPHARDARIFLTGLAIASALAVCPGLHFRPHYFIVLFPAVALLAAVGLADSAVRAAKIPWKWLGAFALAAVLSVASEWERFFTMSSSDVSRQVYGANPFLESVEIARYVRDHSDPGDRIAVLGSEPQIYFYAERRSAARYPHMFALFEPHALAREMQEEMIQEIEVARPRWIILIHAGQSWLMSERSDRTLVEWGPRYLDAHYALDGVVEISSYGTSTYRWSVPAGTKAPIVPDYVLVFRRTG
jgi:hypothetical protein